jgi:hypothetical protein
MIIAGLFPASRLITAFRHIFPAGMMGGIWGFPHSPEDPGYLRVYYSDNDMQLHDNKVFFREKR